MNSTACRLVLRFHSSRISPRCREPVTHVFRAHSVRPRRGITTSHDSVCSHVLSHDQGSAESRQRTHFVLVQCTAYGAPEFTPSLIVEITLQGGPGCSSFDGVMLESGPLRMKEGVLQVIEGGWDEYTTIVFGMSLREKLSGV